MIVDTMTPSITTKAPWHAPKIASRSTDLQARRAKGATGAPAALTLWVAAMALL